MSAISGQNSLNGGEMEKPKRSFEFRMSKKVAELTQVVHMLFTRNHEKEVEIEALKSAYEYEIQLTVTEARKKVEELEQELEDLSKQKAGDNERLKTLLETEIKNIEQEWKKKLSDSENLLDGEKKECQNLRDMLINAQKDIEKLRQGVTEQLTFKTDEITKRDKEIEKLKKQVAMLEKGLHDSEKESNSSLREYERNNRRLEQELIEIQKLLEETHEVRDYLTIKNKQLEGDLKTLRKDFNRKVSEVVNQQLGKLPRSAPSFTGHNEELEKLRREVQRYRLELSNRDLNFNRMFTNQQPIVVDPRSSKGGHIQSTSPSQNFLHQSGPTVNGTHQQMPTTQTGMHQSIMQTQNHSYRLNREKSFTHVGLPHSDRESTSPRANSAGLPNITPTSSPATSADRRARLQKLLKPRPLPKDILYGK